MNKAYVYLETGDHFEAELFTTKDFFPYVSEVVFNTSMQGYQEIITDPSYCDQSILLTYPLIGNYGISVDDNESSLPKLKSLLVREYCDTPSNFRNRQSLADFLDSNNIVGLQKLDTRKITKIIRNIGTMKSIISQTELTEKQKELLFKQELPIDQIEKVSVKQITPFSNFNKYRIVMVDFGYKKNILDSLIKKSCEVIIVPYDTSYETIKNLKPDGVILSNGPGDPKSILKVLPTIKQLQSNYPLFAICMGHQIFALANGADTEKMKFGNRGGNHPVKNLKTNKVDMTAQNHSYCVTKDSLINTELEITHLNINDQTIEGLKHKELNAFSVQFHPEASPGPMDTHYLFDSFIELIKEHKNA